MTNKIGYEIPYCYSRLYIGTYAVSVIYEGAWIADFVSAFVVVKRVLKTLRNVKSFLIVIVSLLNIQGEGIPSKLDFTDVDSN